MSNVELILLQLQKCPEDLTTVAVLTDALIEERDMLRSEADRLAERAVQDARDSREMDRAAELLRADRPWYGVLIRIVLDVAGSAPGDGAQVLIKAGSDGPKVVGALPETDDPFWRLYTVTVGAAWVLFQWHHCPTLWPWSRPTKPKKSRAR